LVVPVTTYDVEANKGNGSIWIIENGQSRKWTSDEINASKPAVSPDRQQVAFVAAVGDGPKQIHLGPLDQPISPESTKPLTDLPLGTLGAKWLPDGSGLVVLAYLLKGHLTIDATAEEIGRRKEVKYTVHVTEDATYRYWDNWLTTGEVPHLFRLDLATGDLRDLTPDSTRWWNWPNTDDPLHSFDISPDGTRIAFSADRSRPPHRHLRRGLFLLNLITGEEADLTPDGVPNAWRPRFSPDGAEVAFGIQMVPDFYGDRVRLATLDVQGGGHRVLTEAWDRSVDQWEYQSDGSIVMTAEEEGLTKLFRLDPRSDPPTPEAWAEGGTITGPQVAEDGSVYVLHHSLTQPPEVARVEPDGILQTVTDFARSLVAGVGWGVVESLVVPGADMEPVQFFLIHPPGQTARRAPFVHLIHGGPHAMFGDAWAWRWHAQTFAAQGYLVAMVNFHGSTSFGQEFVTSIHGAWGDKPYRDIEAVTDFLIGQGIVDEQKMAVAGGSYGGYLTAFVTSQTDRYACAVAHAAVTNLGGMYASDLTAGRVLAYGAEVFDDRSRVERYSPSSHAAGYATPTLVVTGEKDYRVPITQGLELYGVLKAKEVPARLLFYPGENHWILSPQASLHWYSEVLRWLDLYLR
jgi:dipeptidyl aminopeptidase/acylaminoacyl peptidase